MGSRKWRPWLSCGLAAVVVAACSSTSAGVSSTRSEQSPKSSAPTAIVASPASRTTFGSLAQAVLEVTNPDGITAAAGGVWIKTDDGRAVRIDPTTNKITDQVALDQGFDSSTYCQGIGTDGTSVWACAVEAHGTAIAQITPTTGHVVRRVPIDKIFDQLSLPVTARGVWVLTGDGSTVRVIDPATGHSTAYQLGVACQQLAAEGDRVMATASVANVVVVLNAATGAVVGRVHLRGPRIAAMLGGDAWVDTDEGLTRIGPDLAVRAVYPGLVASADGDVVAAAGSVWVRAADGAISRIDPITGRLVERITPDRPLSGGSLHVAFGSIWTTSNDDGTVIRLRLEK